MARVILSKYPISGLCSMFDVSPDDFVFNVIKPIGEDDRDFCINVAPFVMRIYILVITFNQDTVNQHKII